MALIKWFGRGKAAEKRAKAFTASQRKLYPKLTWRVGKGIASKGWKVYANPPRKKRSKRKRSTGSRRAKKRRY